MAAYKPTIGLEIHAELKTDTKMFCDCVNDDQEIEPNKNICPVCTGQPGALPKANKRAIEYVIKTGLALNCAVNRFSKFDRKNYFYPDLPKAYQISQYDLPLCYEGSFELPKLKKTIRITRIHLEEDTAKLSHTEDKKYSLVNFNRAGVPLMELVTEPDFESAQEVVEFAEEFQLMLRYLGVSNADMERGHLRLEANISVAKDSNKELGTKVEVKNLNSFRAVFGAIEYEIVRQAEVLEKGKVITQETRGWDDNKKKTFSQRTKEEAHDYRYFPEPDLPPLRFDDEYVARVQAEVGELPAQKRERFEAEYNLSSTQADELVKEPYYADFFEKAASEFSAIKSDSNVETVYNYLMSDVRGIETDAGISLAESNMIPLHLAHVGAMVQESKISSRVAKDALRESFDTGKSPEDIVKDNNLFQMSDTAELEEIAKQVIDEHETVCHDYKKGKENALQFLVGQVMAKTKGKADPNAAREVLKQLLT